MAKKATGNTKSTGYNASTSQPLEKTSKGIDKLTRMYEKLNKEADKFYSTQKKLGNLGGGEGGNDGELLGANVPSPYGSKLAVAGQVAVGVGAMAYGMMPSAAQAVGQRMSAQYVSSFSGRGITAASVITKGNAMNKGGFTSATSMTDSAGAFLQGGYSFGSTTVQGNMKQLGGMSVISGQTNEQVAAGASSINGMNFLRIGIRARTNSGGLKPINQIANDLYRRMYGNRKPTPEQVAAVMRPNSNAYQTIAQVAGGDANLMLSLQTAIMAQAKNRGAKLDTSDPGKMMDKMGLAADDPMRANFKYQTSEAGKLEATGSGLVAGYSGALNTAASVNDGFTALAQTLGPVTEMFGRLKGFLETMPSLGGTGASLSSFGGSAMNSAMSIAQTRLAMRGLPGGGGTPAAAGAGGGGFFAGSGGKWMRGAGALGGAIGVGTSAYSGYNQGKSGAGFDWMGVAGSAMSGAMTGFFLSGGNPLGALAGAGVGAAVSAGSQLYGQSQAGQGGDASKESVNVTAPVNGSVNYAKPLKTLTMTSGYGKRTINGEPDFHHGLDFRAAVGTPVYAAAAGTARKTGRGRGFGNYVQLVHPDGTESFYGHLSKEVVKSGPVKAGQLIGLSGNTGRSTGPHLHFAVKQGGTYVNPTSWISAAKGNLETPGSDTKSTGVLGFFESVWNSVTGFFSGDSQSSSESASSSSSTSTLGPQGNVLSVGYGGVQGSGISGVLDLIGQGAGIPGGSGGWRRSGSTGVKPSDTTSDEISTKPGSSNDTSLEGSDLKIIGKGGKARVAKNSLLRALWDAGFRGKHLAEAYGVVITESGGRPSAHNPRNKDDSYGLFQINMKNQKGLNAAARNASFLKNVAGYRSKKDLLDPHINIRAAAYMSKRGKDWGSWAQDFASENYKNAVPTLAEVTQLVNQWKHPAAQAPAGAQMSVTGVGGDSHDQHGGGSHGAITINMTVNVAKASEAEAKQLAHRIKQILEEDQRNHRIGQN